jgi:23S rRNA pseudouridine2605 synthase
MLDAVGHPVLKLLRIRMGPLSLGDLEAGEFRFLTDRETNALRALVDERMASAEQGRESIPRPKRPVRREGWAKPERRKKFSGKKVKVA